MVQSHRDMAHILGLHNNPFLSVLYSEGHDEFSAVSGIRDRFKKLTGQKLNFDRLLRFSVGINGLDEIISHVTTMKDGEYVGYLSNWEDHSYSLHVVREGEKTHFIYVNKGQRHTEKQRDAVMVFTTFNGNDAGNFIEDFVYTSQCANKQVMAKFLESEAAKKHLNTDSKMVGLLKKRDQKTGNCVVANSNISWHFQLASELMQSGNSVNAIQIIRSGLPLPSVLDPNTLYLTVVIENEKCILNLHFNQEKRKLNELEINFLAIQQEILLDGGQDQVITDKSVISGVVSGLGLTRSFLDAYQRTSQRYKELRVKDKIMAFEFLLNDKPYYLSENAFFYNFMECIIKFNCSRPISANGKFFDELARGQYPHIVNGIIGILLDDRYERNLLAYQECAAKYAENDSNRYFENSKQYLLRKRKQLYDMKPMVLSKLFQCLEVEKQVELIQKKQSLFVFASAAVKRYVIDSAVVDLSVTLSKIMVAAQHNQIPPISNMAMISLCERLKMIPIADLQNNTSFAKLYDVAMSVQTQLDNKSNQPGSKQAQYSKVIDLIIAGAAVQQNKELNECREDQRGFLQALSIIINDTVFWSDKHISKSGIGANRPPKIIGEIAILLEGLKLDKEPSVDEPRSLDDEYKLSANQKHRASLIDILIDKASEKIRWYCSNEGKFFGQEAHHETIKLLQAITNFKYDNGQALQKYSEKFTKASQEINSQNTSRIKGNN